MANKNGPYAVRLQDSQIRILTLLPGDISSPIVCTLTRASLDHKPQYDALSYVWGDASDIGLVRIDQHAVSITANLEAALRHLRLGTLTRRLWVDAVCINQQDLEERSAQVSMMGTIYSSAQKVYIWIGEADDLSDAAFAAIPAIADGAVDHEAKDEVCSFYLSLTRRTWFSRIWILQELALAAEDPVVVCGTRQVAWTIFMSAWEALAKIYFAELGWVRRNSDGDTVEVLGGIKIDSLHRLRSAVHREGGQSLKQLLIQSRSSDCTDSKDRIYGLLGMLKDEDFASYPEIDYQKSTSVIYSEAMAHIFSRGQGPDFLTGMWLPGISPQLPGLPSWALDFSRQSGAKANAVWCIDFRPPHPQTASGVGAEAVNGTVLEDLLTLKIEALPIDTVQDIIHLPADFRECLLQLDHINRLARSSRAKRIASASNATMLQKFKDSEPLWRVLISNKAHMSGYDVAPDEYEAMFLDLLPHHRHKSLLHHPKSDIEVTDTIIPDNDYVNSLRSHLPRHAFFTTVQGFIGMASQTILPGDEITIWFGAAVPFVTRAMAANVEYCQLVSAAYVGGVMQGQMVDELYCEDLADSTTLLVR